MCIQPIINIWHPVTPIDYESLAILIGTMLGIRTVREIGSSGYGKGKKPKEPDCEL
jgi:hypothetical protein